MPSSYRCVICEVTIPPNGIDKLKKCPGCGVQLRAVDTKYDLEIPLNWNELRLLAQWADNFAQKEVANDDPEYLAFISILWRLSQYQPEGQPCLTKIDQELKEFVKDMAARLRHGMIGRDGTTIHKIPSTPGEAKEE